MKKLILFSAFAVILFSSCDHFLGKPIKGNGNVHSESRNISSAQKIKLAGSYDVELIQGTASLKISADENLLPYIETYNEDGWLIVKTKEGFNLKPTSSIKVVISTDMLEAVKIAGSGSIIGKDKFSGGSNLDLDIAGSGNINLEINTPHIKSSIAGSGDIILAGETKDEEIHIAGHGNYKAETLKAESADVHIAGSGYVNVFAENKLNINIAGSGDVNYKGNATVEQHIAGSGTVKKMQ